VHRVPIERSSRPRHFEVQATDKLRKDSTTRARILQSITEVEEPFEVSKRTKLKRDSGSRNADETQSHRARRGIKDQNICHLENSSKSGRTKKLRRRSNNNRQIGCREKSGPSDQSPDRRNMHKGRTDLVCRI
jgi:hypothetical protein